KTTDITLPSALYMLDLALPQWFAGQIISPLDIEPIYLRNEVTWKKLPGRE
ncbi:MAG: tRNA (adenosine(37)-N6)-threonylcarbamoyltransferase complex dimerization subunit type 1 TsaB, partial [Aggregatibacter aphrophilus]|nr:tRNA (adenosine(37)-N6)-threonylcarbamoyltransferase complex dimerization subunit type 1 TsaB [Aggregatibacter aphrophilus]